MKTERDRLNDRIKELKNEIENLGKECDKARNDVFTKKIDTMDVLTKWRSLSLEHQFNELKLESITHKDGSLKISLALKYEDNIPQSIIIIAPSDTLDISVSK